MLRCILQDEMDNLQSSVGKKDIFSVQNVTQATAAPGLHKSSTNLFTSPLAPVSHMHFVALISERRISHVFIMPEKNTWIYKTAQYNNFRNTA